MQPVRSSWPRAVLLAPLVLALVACDEEPSGPQNVVDVTPWLVTSVSAVNDAGVVVASVRRDSMNLTTAETVTQRRAATWTEDGGLHVLPPADGVVQLSGIDINAAGHVLAAAVDSDGRMHALVWNGSTWTDRGEFQPTALDGQGNAVGYLYDAELFERTPVVGTAGATSPQLLAEKPAGDDCELDPDAAPLDISPAGIVGLVYSGEAIIWTSTSSAELIFTYPSCGEKEESTAEAIDDAGNIVGWSGEFGLAYIRRPGQEPEPLATLPGAPTLGWARSCAYGIAHDGSWIVGTSDSENGWRAVRWNAEREVEDLGAGKPYDVNAHGMAVGEILVGDPGSVMTIEPAIWFPDGSRYEFTQDELAPSVANASAAPRGPESLPC